MKFSTWGKETVVDRLKEEVLTLSLLPIDCGFCPKTLLAEIKIPSVNAIRVSYINEAGTPAIFFGNSERAILVLRSNGYKVMYEE
jgi:hypothetical protein